MVELVGGSGAMEVPRVLIVEDSPDVSRFVSRGLKEEGFQVAEAQSGEVALRHMDSDWDLIILDLMLPDMSGETLLEYLMQKNSRPPVLVLTAKSRLEDKISLFQRGCDDYLTKPFAFEELLGRVRALLRRSPRIHLESYQYEDMTLDPSTHQLKVSERTVHLTPKEFAIIRLLMREPGRVVNRKELLHGIWGLKHEPRTNFIEVHLANLRKKLALASRDSWLQTIRTTGICLSRPNGH